MITWRIIAACLIIALISAGAGFWFGFRQAWTLGPMVNAAPSGAVGLQLMRSIDAGRAHEATYYFESQVDSGLMFWHDAQSSALYPFLNQLSGTDVTPGTEKYVRQLAAFRKTHPSPLWDPKEMADVETYLREHKPDMAEHLLKTTRESKDAMDAVVLEYAP